MPKKLSVVADVITILGMVFVGVTASRHLIGRVGSPPEITPGERLPLAAAEWNSKRTVVLFLSTQVRYSAESAPFYSILISAASQKGIPVIAVLPEPKVQAAAFLKQLGLQVAAIQQAERASIRVRGIPTILLVDDKGTVIQMWRGTLNSKERQEAMLNAL